MSNPNDILASMATSGEYDFELRYYKESNRMRTKFVDAVLDDSEAYGIVIEACWANGAQDELRKYLKGEDAARNVRTIECAHYCEKGVLDDEYGLNMRATTAMATLGIGFARLVLERIHNLFNENIDRIRSEAGIELSSMPFDAEEA